MPNESEQAVIALILHLRSENTSLRKIAEHLNSQLIPTKKGKAKWSHNTVSSIIKKSQEAERREEAA